MESNLITEDKQKNKLEKAFEILKTMASKPSGLIGLTIVLFHVVLALISPYKCRLLCFHKLIHP
jgi:peptide/nickel transport system permease protein